MRFKYGRFYYLLSAVLISYAIINLISVNWGFSNYDRGVGQFDRSLADALSRISVLSLPLTLFYMVSYDKKRLSNFVLGVLLTSVILKSISLGDRRMLFYYAILFVFVIYRYGAIGRVGLKFITKKNIFIVLMLSSLLGAYVFRALGTDKFEYIGFMLLQGTFGGLGIGHILAEVKQIVAEDTGYLFGEPFLNYIWGVFVPSFVFYLLGSDEFYLRSSYLFNDLFNTNVNMGYDFMMLADFYWSFSYFGYILYLVIFYIVCRVTVRGQNSPNNLMFGNAVLLAIFFIAGQRSDFGFFLKSYLYSAVFYYALCKLSPRKKVKIVN
ncbi:hypothetical protein KFJ24_09215 [Marinobacter sediminum]|uniref:hypothetical protein n=1 Tax=Marinobacter sediminum TaxID=256323 RepID=UPI00202E54C8|nr:hypothetical protein [Marinobacter sediminum]MCM0612644.1 hypothetical protein [Marinobacter sediminum]